MAQVRRQCGKPAGVRRRREGLLTEFYQADQVSDLLPQVGRVGVLYSQGRVAQVQVWSQAFRTPEGVTTATRLSRRPERSRFTKHISGYKLSGPGDWLYNTYFDDVERGVALEMGLYEGLVGLDRKPNSIIVHRAGADVIAADGEIKQRGDYTRLPGVDVESLKLWLAPSSKTQTPAASTCGGAN